MVKPSVKRQFRQLAAALGARLVGCEAGGRHRVLVFQCASGRVLRYPLPGDVARGRNDARGLDNCCAAVRRLLRSETCTS